MAAVLPSMMWGCAASSTEAPTRTHAISSGTRPIAELPGGVEAPAGVLTLWADYAAAGTDEVPLYLVYGTGGQRSSSWATTLRW